MLSLYIDSADREVVTRLLATGLFEGVTTNPAILDRSQLTSTDIPSIVSWAVEAGAQRVFVQAWGTRTEDLVQRGREFRRLSSHVVVKVPASAAGIVAARELAQDGEVLVTAVHAATQIIPVIASGATYAAPFLSRMADDPAVATAEILRMQTAVTQSESRLHVLAGSVRTPDQVLQLVMAGIRHVTMGPAVWEAFLDNGLTTAAVSHFERLATGLRRE